jgi:hypothetical protein
MKTTNNPLPVQIPRRYASLLGIDPTFLYRINLGQRKLSPELADVLMDLAASDPELVNLKIEDLRPELEILKEHLCKRCQHHHAEKK